jgi:hypothetical protein
MDAADRPHTLKLKPDQAVTRPAADPRADPGLPLVVDAKGLARLLDGSLRWIRSLDSSRKLPAPRRISGRVVWSVDEIQRWIEAGTPSRQVWEARHAAVRTG